MRTFQKLKTLVVKLSRNKVDILGGTPIEEENEGKPEDCVSDTSDMDYIEDMLRFYKLSEHSSLIHDKDHKPNTILIDRVAIVNKLIIKHHELRLKPETLHLCICIFDKCLCVEEITGREIDLAGISAMFIASKYEEIRREVDLDRLGGVDYSTEEIVAMEKRILQNLGWMLTFPTPFMFIGCLLQKAPSPRSKVMEDMVFFFAELGMVHCSTRKFCPSMIAASALYAARVMLNEKPFWTKKMEGDSGYSELQLMNRAQMLLSYGSSILCGLTEVHTKYSSPQLGFVALRCFTGAKTFKMLRLRKRELRKD